MHLCCNIVDYYIFALYHRIAGKTTLLKALAGQLNTSSGHLEGDILYNGDSIDCGKYLVGKVATYVDEKEQHAGTLTVRETLEFAWKMTTGGHHGYSVAKDADAAEIMNKDDAVNLKVRFLLYSPRYILRSLNFYAQYCFNSLAAKQRLEGTRSLRSG